MQDVIPSTLNYSGCEADRTWALDRFPPPDDIIVQLFESLERGGGTKQTRTQERLYASPVTRLYPGQVYLAHGVRREVWVAVEVDETPSGYLRFRSASWKNTRWPDQLQQRRHASYAAHRCKPCSQGHVART